MLALSLVGVLLAVSATPDAVILRIQDEIRSGDLVRAETELAAALRQDPENGGLYNLRGIIHAQRSDLKAAASDFEQATRFSPGLAGAAQNLERALSTLAQEAERQNDLKGALGYLARAREVKPDDAGIHFFFGVVCIQLNLVVEAKKSLDRALELDGSNVWYNYARGSVELQGRSAWLAVPYFQKALAVNPHEPRVRFALAVAEFASQDYDSAKRDLTAVATRKETLSGAEYFLGRIAKAESDWTGAARCFATSIAAEPGYAESHAELGLARMHLGDLESAQREIQRAIELNPNSYIANLDLLALYQRTKDPRSGDQRQKLAELETQRVERQDLMLRTIKVIR